ncbi:cytochrome c oxidase accessory protein CcoG [uncultured Dechloromonas sp.]|uniref:cytochrome c oxidase accessory protein CcoG n=1 Tax=uncultured Dechloromonas sp. TaxID=171719 RepID=UPI0025CE4B9D|nr:cytochrome c oxidase accessory protein CcoG [uncultured Dechloromonas sp.]
MSENKPSKRVIEIKPVLDVDAKVYPRSITGYFQRWRWVMVGLTQLVFYGLCWLPWNGRQAVLFDLDARRFYLFDFVLWPQDTIYLAILLALSALALFLFTAVAGRLWCGYTCPQTVYTEIFLWLERLVEGDRPKRIKLDAAPWSPRKLAIKSAKHGLWLALALWTGLTFVGYFTPIRELLAGVGNFSLGPWEIFWVFFYGAATYGNAGFLREHMCKYICPYAQFQFVMFDRDTLNITYDKERGDPRGGRAKGADPRSVGLGDCIDCSICVQVCPTGIDIRDGLQLECIGCAACVDACDQVMDKMGYPRGLIRYSTENAVLNKATRGEIIRRAFRPRVLIYLAIFLSVSLATAWSLATKVPLKVSVIRDRAAMSREAADGSIENSYTLQLTNASEQTRRYRISVDGLPGLRIADEQEVSVPAAAIGEAALVLSLEQGAVGAGAHNIRIRVEDVADPAVAATESARFWMP